MPDMCWGHSGGPDNPCYTLLKPKVPWEKKNPSPESDNPESLRLGVGVGMWDVETETVLASLDVREDYLEEGSSETVGGENWPEAGGKPVGAWQESPADSEGPESHARETEVCPKALGELWKAY